MLGRNKTKEPTTPTDPTGADNPDTIPGLRQQLDAALTRLAEMEARENTLFAQLHAKDKEIENASADSVRLREILTEEKCVLQEASEIAGRCMRHKILFAHRWFQQGQQEAYAKAAQRIQEALDPTVFAPPPSEGLLKAQQQIADFMIQGAQRVAPTDADKPGTPGIEKGHEFPQTECPHCDWTGASNWQQRHINEKHPDKLEVQEEAENV